MTEEQLDNILRMVLRKIDYDDFDYKGFVKILIDNLDPVLPRAVFLGPEYQASLKFIVDAAAGDLGAVQEYIRSTSSQLTGHCCGHYQWTLASCKRTD